MVVPEAQISVLFIGLDNVCRSVVAQAVFEDAVRQRGLTGFVGDSAGTSWRYVGNAPTEPVCRIAHLRGYRVAHQARRFHPDDFGSFDLLIAMDGRTVHDLERVRMGMELRRSFHLLLEPQQVQLLRRWDPYGMPGDEDLPEPNALEESHVEAVFDVVERSIPPLLDHLQDLVAVW